MTNWGHPASFYLGSRFAAISISCRKAFTICWIETAIEVEWCWARALSALVCCFLGSTPSLSPSPRKKGQGDRGARVRRLHWYQSPFITHSSVLWSRSQTAQESYSPIWQWGGGWSGRNSVFGQSPPIWNDKVILAVPAAKCWNYCLVRATCWNAQEEKMLLTLIKKNVKSLR